MKLVFTGLSALIVAVTLLAVPARAAEGPYFIHNTEVNLRAEPGGEILMVLDVNDKVFVIERDGDWSYVSAPGREAKGWVWSAFYGDGRVTLNEAVEIVPISTAAPAPPPAAEPAQQNTDPAKNEAAAAPDRPASRPDPVVEDERAVVQDLEIVDSGSLVVATYAPEGDDALLRAEVPPEHEVAPGKITDGFIPDNAEQQLADGGAAQADRYTPIPRIDTSPPPAPVEQPAARLAVAETAAAGSEPVVVEFYQPFERNAQPAGQVDVTVPAALGGSYFPVGGNNIALITGTNVNVRGEGSLSADIMGRVSNGEKCYLIGEREGWCYVSIPGRDLKGWVSSDYVSKLPRVEITGDDVRLREKPDTAARIKAELYRGEVFFKFDDNGKWAEVASSSSGLRGWVHKDYLKQTERQPSRPYKVTGDDVNFRVSPEVDSDIITALSRGTVVQVLGRNDKWSFIDYSGQQGWMYSQYLDPDFPNAPRAVYGKSIGGRLIQRAQAMAGTPYVWGGESDDGVDCSGLIYKLLLDEGADASGLPRRASTQMAGLGQPVDKENLEPGDLVFFTTYKPGASHVGIYLGDGDFIHASSARGKVTINSMSEGYYKKRFVGARRITENELRSMK